MTKTIFIPLLITMVFGCTIRGVDTTMTPQLYSNGEVVYVYSDLANFTQPDQDPEAEKNRLRSLSEWVSDSGICPNGFSVLKRQPISVLSWSQGKKIYYFIKCN